MMISRRKILACVIFFLISIALSLLFAEYLTRKFVPQSIYNFAKDRSFAIFLEDKNIPFTLQRNVKKYRFISNMVEFSHLVSTNSFGFRGEEISQEKPG